MKQSSRDRGAEAEARALDALRTAGLTLVERNWHCRYGELDLIMRDGEELVFVEVRSRRRPIGSPFANAAESIGPRKQQRLLRTAACYLGTLRTAPRCRFDVVTLESKSDGTIRQEWIQDAFEGPGS